LRRRLAGIGSGKNQRRPIGRPGERRLDITIIGDLLESAAITRHDPDIELIGFARDCDQIAISAGSELVCPINKQALTIRIEEPERTITQEEQRAGKRPFRQT
jgi:hypothetical protein